MRARLATTQTVTRTAGRTAGGIGGLALGAMAIGALLSTSWAAAASKSEADPTLPAAGLSAHAAESADATDPAMVLEGEVTRIDGTEEDLAKYRGKVVLVVNTASRCGFTSQYDGLEKLYRAHKDDGLMILAFPSNDFMGQEPGSNEQIAAFCSERFDVTFPLFEKTPVTGEKAHPLFKRLAEQEKPVGEPPKWNFTKYLIDRSGRAIARYPSKVAPQDAKFQEAIAEALAEPAPDAGGNTSEVEGG